MAAMNNEKISQTQMVIAETKNGKKPPEIIINMEKLTPLRDILLEELGRKDISADVLAELAGLGRATVYKILQGKMRPSQDVLLRIAFVLEMDAEKTQELLKSGHVALLTGSRERDVMIIYGLQNHLSLGEMDYILAEYGLPVLVPEK